MEPPVSHNMAVQSLQILATAEEINLIIVVTTIASNGKSSPPSKSTHFWWRSRFLIKLTISVPSATLSVKIFVSSLLHNKLKFTRKSGHAKKKWSTFSVSFLQMKQESPLLPVSHGTPAFGPKLLINLVCVCKRLTRSG